MLHLTAVCSKTSPWQFECVMVRTVAMALNSEGKGRYGTEMMQSLGSGVGKRVLRAGALCRGQLSRGREEELSSRSQFRMQKCGGCRPGPGVSKEGKKSLEQHKNPKANGHLCVFQGDSMLCDFLLMC